MEGLNKNESVDLIAEQRKNMINNIKPQFDQALDSLKNHSLVGKDDDRNSVSRNLESLKNLVSLLEKSIEETTN